MSIIPGLMICLSSNMVYGQSPSLSVEITNIEEKTGYIMLAVYNQEEHFLTEEVLTAAREQVRDDDRAMIEIRDLKPGRYAISVYHDVNGNGELDTNLFNIPKEPYGFSNNDLGLFGIPSFEKSFFEVADAPQKIVIELR